MIDAGRSGPDRPLPPDLRRAIAALNQRFNTCRLIALRDLRDALPPRAISRGEVDQILASLADHGLSLLEGDASDLVSR